MSNAYIEAEVKKVHEDSSYKFPLNLAMSAAWILGNFKGLNLKILNVGSKSSLADYFVMGSATNQTQAKSMAEMLTSQLRKLGHEVKSVEGLGDAEWILIDAGDILVHIFLETSRDAFGLDDLWREAEHITIPSAFYLSHDENEEEKEEQPKPYF